MSQDLTNSVQALAAVRGVFCGFDSGGEPLVDFEPNRSGAPIAAISTVPLNEADRNREVVLLFEDGDLSRPIVVGLRQASFSAAKAAELIHRDPASGDVIVENGKSKITLRNDGTVRIEGRRIVNAAEEDLVVSAAYIELN